MIPPSVGVVEDIVRTVFLRERDGHALALRFVSVRFHHASDEIAAETALPVGYLVDFGGDERVGRVEEEGTFVPVRHPVLLDSRRMVGLGPGLALLVPCRGEALDPSGRPIADLEFAVRDRRAVCVAIVARDGQAITPGLLREIPLARLARSVIAEHAVRLMRTSDDFLFAATFPLGEAGFGDLGRELREHYEKATGKIGRRPLSGEFLDVVASIYREALARGLSPGVELRRRLGPTTPENARRWVMLARRRGHLGPALGSGRRGEAIPTTDSRPARP